MIDFVVSMGQKYISWCAEYLIFVGAFIVLIFLSTQSTVYDSLLKFLTLVTIVVSLWYIGAFLKFFIRKERPKEKLHNIIERDRYTFPSMHALTISSASSYICMYSQFFGFIMFVIAFIIMCARVRTHMHYMVDMIAGFCFGAIFAYIFSPFFEKYIILFLLS